MGVISVELGERKLHILQAIIEDYIVSGEPVGSRTIAKKYGMGISSATIRNEMADLEEIGYLVQPYTSAGRIPSDKGYRLYINELMDTQVLTENQVMYIRKAMELKVKELTTLIRQTSEVLSDITKLTSLIVTPERARAVIKAVQVVPVVPRKALIILVASGGFVKNSIINIPADISADYLIRLSNLLNERLS